ncbi:CotH kinase family protein [Acinetobacter seifertii]|uniref:CotH kinase family protein n=1 Tax=Acinetobacter seifertii TaxID=1530123 RepID=UPI00124FF5E6|nr:CotH kinase family protein [Acinetobacter seifertii]
MTNLTPKSQWDGVYQLERNDPALAGPGGILNKPLQDLTNRTEYLNDTKANKTDIVKGQYSFTTLAKFNEKKATIPADSTVIIDEAGANQGTNTWDGATLTKSAYDPLAQAKADATAKAEAAKNDAIHTAGIDAQIKADDAEKSAKEFSELLNSKLENSFNNSIAHIIVSLNLICQSYTLFLKQYDIDHNDVLVKIAQTVQTLEQLKQQTDSQSDEIESLKIATDRLNDSIADVVVSVQLISLFQLNFSKQYDSDQNEILQLISDVHLKISAGDEHNLNLISNLVVSNHQLSKLIDTVYRTFVSTDDANQDKLSKLVVSNHQLSKLIDTVHKTFVNTDDANQDQFSNLVVANSQITMLIKTLQQSLGLVDDQHNDQLSKLVTTVHSINQILTTLTEQAIVKPMLNSVFVFPEPQSIAVIDIATDSALPVTKEDGMKPCRVTIDINGQIAKIYAKFGVQGQSSAGFPKKNWSFDFYKDAAGSSSFDIKIGAVKAQDSFNFKANFIDHLHVRQMFNLELWQEIQNSRHGYPKQDIDNYYIGKTGKDAVPTGATAAPYMYPAVCNINSEFYGVGCIHYAKKRSNYNIAKNKPKEILIDFGGITSIDEMDPTIIEIKAPSSPTAATLAAIERWRVFAKSSSENIAANYASYLSKQNIIDYYCYVDFICGADIVFKNLMMYSWDGNIWRIGVYDVDMTYGLDFDGTVTRFTPTYDAFQGNGFWDRIHIAFQTDIEARYAELRRLGLFSVDHVYLSMSHLLSFYPSDLLSAEYTKWNPPSLTQTTFAALLEWVKQRLVFLDAKHNYTGN